MIYAPGFDALPEPALDAVYRRMWQVLSGQETSKRYGKLTPADRTAITEVLRDTKKSLPPYFRAGTRDACVTSPPRTAVRAPPRSPRFSTSSPSSPPRRAP